MISSAGTPVNPHPQTSRHPKKELRLETAIWRLCLPFDHKQIKRLTADLRHYSARPPAKRPHRHLKNAPAGCKRNMSVATPAPHLGRWSSELGRWSSELGRWSSELGRWTSELDSWSSELERWSSELERWSSELERWSSELERWSSELERWSSELERWSSELERWSSELERWSSG
jgi:hypothetical protein